MKGNSENINNYVFDVFHLILPLKKPTNKMMRAKIFINAILTPVDPSIVIYTLFVIRLLGFRRNMNFKELKHFVQTHDAVLLLRDCWTIYTSLTA